VGIGIVENKIKVGQMDKVISLVVGFLFFNLGELR
jgi:hypothetical protein